MSRNSDPVGDPYLEHLHQLGANQAVEEGRDVGLQNPVHLVSVHRVVDGSKGVMGSASGPEAIRAVQKVLL